jgi:hypothetical protein
MRRDKKERSSFLSRFAVIALSEESILEHAGQRHSLFNFLVKLFADLIFQLLPVCGWSGSHRSDYLPQFNSGLILSSALAEAVLRSFLTVSRQNSHPVKINVISIAQVVVTFTPHHFQLQSSSRYWLFGLCRRPVLYQYPKFHSS